MCVCVCVGVNAHMVSLRNLNSVFLNSFCHSCSLLPLGDMTAVSLTTQKLFPEGACEVLLKALLVFRWISQTVVVLVSASQPFLRDEPTQLDHEINRQYTE